MTDLQRKAIREQLERILASPLFRNSKRYPNLLRFVVEKTLDGHADHLKERTLGVDVFHRAPDYDSNLDPVVRTTAVEIRKRIALYYHDPEHSGEMRIDFPAGSYIPEFRIPPEAPIQTHPIVERPPAQSSGSRWWSSRTVAIGLVASVVVAIALLASTSSTAVSSTSSTHPLDGFWGPVWNSPMPVLFLIGHATAARQPGGVPAKPGPAPVSVVELMREESVAFADATTLAKLSGLMISKGKPVRIRRYMTAKFDDLRDGPVILIGGFNNDWTLRLAGQMRFSFERTRNLAWIADRENPANRSWNIDMDLPYRDVAQDYAIISRVLDPTTGRIVVTAAGLSKFGTAAAGEFLSDPAYFQRLAKSAPKGWEQKNMQIVIATKLVGEGSSPPSVLATYYW